MGHLLAKWIYPHFANNHHPFAIRHQALFSFIVLLTLAQITTNLIAGQPKILGFATNITQTDIITLTNKERDVMGRPLLKESSILNRAAALKADDMITDNYWAHFAPDGTSPWYFFEKVEYKYTWAGENLARDFQTSGGVVAGWMASTAGHRENILNSSFTEIGVAVKNGVLLGEETTLVVQLFANPVNYTASAPTSQQSQSTGVTVEDRLTLPLGEKKESDTNTQIKQTPIAEGISGKGTSSYNLVGMVENLSTSQKTSFGLLLVLGSLFTLDSATIFRKRHSRSNSHSGLHSSVIFILMVTLLAQSVGSIS